MIFVKVKQNEALKGGESSYTKLVMCVTATKASSAQSGSKRNSYMKFMQEILMVNF